MIITKHTFVYKYKEVFPDAIMIGGFEGGAIFQAIKDYKHYLIIDEGTLADFLDDDDKDLLDQLIKIIEFDSIEELESYLKSEKVNYN
jgi:hypothetical protein